MQSVRSFPSQATAKTQSRFAGTSLINPTVVYKMAGTRNASLPPELSALPGFSGWVSSHISYDNGMTVELEKGPVLNDKDEAIRKAAWKLADKFFDGDIRKVLFQTPVALTPEVKEVVTAGLATLYGWGKDS